MIAHRCACQKSYTSIIITSITWADPRCVQEAATFLGPQNRTQGRCVLQKAGVTELFGTLHYDYKFYMCVHLETQMTWKQNNKCINP